ncbi:uncharacterized protein LOC134107813 isoform X2 [Pungitius pungitius]|uniref:uncharacterized protein LOC134107813 isoform X2 n=1 Tax=Pungitius pungitius TaxID=134920 RepID=UPI002E137102
MTRINSEGYRPLRNDDDQPQRVSGKTFFVHLAGKTNGAHGDFVRYLTSNGKVEVDSYAASDFLVVFCPVVSRVGTDIEAALSDNSVLTDGKPTLLVVMHHTFDPNHVVAESRRQVSDPRVWLTVDCLFHQGKLLQHCPLNDAMRVQVGNFLEFSFCSKIPPKWYLVGAVVGVVVVVLVVSVIVPLIYTWNKNNQNQTAYDMGMN